MNLARQQSCDALLAKLDQMMPDPPPASPPRPVVRRPKPFHCPPKFALVPEDFYITWCIHRREVSKATHKVDNIPPALLPKQVMKPHRLDAYAKTLEENMYFNKLLLKGINLIQREGGVVDCWMPEMKNNKIKKLFKLRQEYLNNIRISNRIFYSSLIKVKSKQPASELEEEWKNMKQNMIKGARLPFILFKSEKIDRDMHDPAFDRPINFQRTKVNMVISVRGGSKLGKVTIELFNEIVPKTCELFLNLLKGDSQGYAYKDTRIFRVVPNLYCRGGDVAKDNGFGCYVPPDEKDPMKAENYTLKHSVPGVLSMAVTPFNEVYGQFNIIFKPLPQFDGKHVVFGRIISGPAKTMELISAIGLPLGPTTVDCIIKSCGWFSRNGEYEEGKSNKIKFPK